MPTYLCFVDLTKAFDKLRCILQVAKIKTLSTILRKTWSDLIRKEDQLLWIWFQSRPAGDRRPGRPPKIWWLRAAYPCALCFRVFRLPRLLNHINCVADECSPNSGWPIWRFPSPVLYSTNGVMVTSWFLFFLLNDRITHFLLGVFNKLIILSNTWNRSSNDNRQNPILG